MRDIFAPRTIRVCRDSSTNVHPCFFSQRLNSLAFTIQMVTTYGYSVKP